jgi:phage/plasmid-associated DNA primase
MEAGEVTMKASGRTYGQLQIEEWLASRPPPIVTTKTKAENDDPFRRHAKAVGFTPPIDPEARLRAMKHKGPGDTAVHQTQLQVTASLLQAGLGEDEVVERVLDATKASTEGRPDWNWDREEREIKRMCASWLKKHPPKPARKPRNTAAKVFAELNPLVEQLPQRKSRSLNGKSDAQVDRRDDPDPPETTGQVVSLAVARAERELKKTKPKNAHVVLGQGLLEALRERGEQILYEGVWLYRYRNILWERIFPDLAKAWLNTEIQTGCEALGVTPTNHLKNETRGWIEGLKELKRDKVLWDEHGGFATHSGLFDLETLKLTPLKPEHYATRCVESEYDPKAKCPWWIRMLEDMFEGDQATISALQEIAGAALLTHKPKALSKALLLRGDTNSGKSAVLMVLAYLLSDNPIVVTFDGMKDHGTEPFLRHAPWLLTEAFEQSAWHPSATVKAILANEAIEINPKGTAKVTHVFRGPVFWGSNYPAKFKESSKAMIERMWPIPCPVEFDPKRPVGAAAEAIKRGYNHPHELVLKTERPGVLNWMLEGLIRVRKRGYVEDTPTMRDELSEIRRESNVVAGFIASECADLNEKSMVSSPDLLAAITMWHSSERGVNYVVLSGRQIIEQIKASFDNSLVNYRSDSDNYYVGVRLTDLGKRYWASMTDAYRAAPAGKYVGLSGNADEVNKTSPVTLKQARALRAQRQEKDRARKNNEGK